MILKSYAIMTDLLLHNDFNEKLEQQMKKTIIFLNQRSYDLINFSQLKALGDYRCVAILTEQYHKAFPASVMTYFDQLYTVQSHYDLGFENVVLHTHDTEKIVADEIALALGPENVHIVCTDEFNMLLAAQCRERFGIKGPGVTVIERYRDKLSMKKALNDSEVRVPVFLAFDIASAFERIDESFAELVVQLSLPFVIKPVSGVGSAATAIIKTENEFRIFVETYHQSDYKFEAEEFIDGTLYHCDALVQNGNIIFSFVGQYGCPNLEFTKGKTLHSLPLIKGNPIRESIIAVFDKVISVLGRIDGPYHMEVFHTPQKELVFLEIAARTIGGGFASRYQRMYGINMYDANLLIQVGEIVQIPSIEVNEYEIVGMIPKVSGKISDIQEPSLLSKYHIDWYVHEGDEMMDRPITLLDQAGRLRVWNQNYQELEQDFATLRNYQPFKKNLC